MSESDTERAPVVNTEIEEPALCVVGIGRMGCGIALSFVCAGYCVSLIDSEDRSDEDFATLVRSTRSALQADLAFLTEAGVVQANQSTNILTQIELLSKSEAYQALERANFVFEAVSEVINIKESTYAWLNDTASKEAIFASTTSTILANQLAQFVDNMPRFLNAHWLNPAWLMPLIEISPSEHTSEETVTGLEALLEGIGKKTVVCAASPGYIVSRLQALALNEAARMVEEGVASAEDVDKAVRYGFGVRYATLGMLEFIDWGGGDILYHACNYLAENIDHHRFAPADIVLRHMQEDKNGLRDGVGFYDYQRIDIKSYRAEKLGAFVSLLKHLDLMPSINTGNKTRTR